MKLYTIGTGSSGNCYLLVDGNDILILDAGVNPTQRISKYLYDLRPALPCGCLVTHEHGDHSCAVPELVRMGIDCYGSPGTAERVGFGMKSIRPYDPSWISQDVKAFGDAFLVMAFKTNHDAAEPCGFLFPGMPARFRISTGNWRVRSRGRRRIFSIFTALRCWEGMRRPWAAG